MKTPRITLLKAALRTLIVSTAAAGGANAQTVSLNFTDSDAGSVINTGTPGAVQVAASNWNNLASVNGDGTVNNLKDNTGAATSTSVTWASANTWRGGGTTTTGNGQLTKGYLDDGGGGCLISVSNIPYLSYNAYVVLGTDQGNTTKGSANYRPVSVNGVGYSHNDTATVAQNVNWTGQNWTDSAPLVEGQNYLKIQNLGGLSLTVRGGNNSGGFRGPIAGLQIENTYTGSFAYWDRNGNAVGAGGASPAGTWDTATANWNATADGTGTPGLWTGAGKTAVFAAGGDATGAYTVNISGTQTTDAVLAEQGNITLSGGTLNLAAPAVIRTNPGSSLTLNTILSGTSGVVLEGATDINVSGVHPVTGAAVFSVPSLVLNSGTSFPSLSGLVVGDGVSMIANTSTLTATGGMTVGNGSQINAASSVVTIGGDIVFTGAGISASGTTTLSARNLYLNAGAVAASMSLGGTSIVNLTNTAPAQSTFELNSGALTMGDATVLNADRWTNRGSGIVHTLNISGTAAINLTDDLVFGDNSNASITITQTGGTVTNTGVTNNPGGNDLSNRWGHWGGGNTTYNISAGSLNLTGSPLYLSWDSPAILDISSTALVNLKGVNMGYGGRTNASTINLNGGRLNIGSDGITTGGTTNKTVNLGLGTLAATASWDSNVAMNVAAAHTIDTGNFQIALNAALTGTGSITKIGSGTLVVTGQNTFTGGTNVNAGTFRMGGTSDGVVNIAATATAGAGPAAAPGVGAVTTLNLANGSSSVFRMGADADSLNVVNLSTGAAHTINIEGAVGLAPGTYPLFNYETAIGGSGYPAFALGSRPHILAELNHNTAETSVDLVITGVDTLVWKGNNGSAWNVNDTSNWTLASNSNGAPYFQTDLVLFNDSATTGNVVLSGTINPGEVSFDNSSLDYTLSGAGIGGNTQLIKDGTAKVTLANNNTYVGATLVNAGKLQVGDGTSGSISPSSTVTILPDAEFILMGVNGNFQNTVRNEGLFRVAGAANVSLNGDWSGFNPGSIVVDSTGITSLITNKVNWTGDLTVNAGTLRTMGFSTNSLGAGANTRTLTFNGANTKLSMEQNNIFGGGGTVAANIPKLVLNGASVISNAYNVMGDITMNGAKLTGSSVDASANYRGFEFRGGITVTGTAPSLIETTTAHENHLDAATTFVVEDVTTSAATDLLVSAPFRDASPDNGSIVSGLVKQGAGTMELTAVSTYTGATDVQAGRLKVNGTLGATAVTVASGASLGGNATIGGAITVASGGLLEPGASAGTINAGAGVILNGTLKVELDGSAGDRLNVTGALDITNATVDFSVLGGGATLGSYVIAQYGTRTGTAFATVNNLPPGYTLNYAFGPNSNQIALVNPSANPYLTWATSPPYNLSGGNELSGADPDKDGITNGIEFVVGGNPTSSGDGAKLPAGAVVGANFEFTFRRTDLSNYAPFPAVQYGSLLSGWTTAQNGVNGVVITETNDFYGAGVDKVVVSIPRSLAVGDKLFARLIADQ